MTFKEMKMRKSDIYIINQAYDEDFEVRLINYHISQAAIISDILSFRHVSKHPKH